MFALLTFQEALRVPWPYALHACTARCPARRPRSVPGARISCICIASIAVYAIDLSGFSSTRCPPAVDGGERAVMYDRLQGVLPQPIGEGTHFRIPWVQSPNVMDIRTRPRSISSVTGTKGTVPNSPPARERDMFPDVVEASTGVFRYQNNWRHAVCF